MTIQTLAAIGSRLIGVSFLMTGIIELSRWKYHVNLLAYKGSHDAEVLYKSEYYSYIMVLAALLITGIIFIQFSRRIAFILCLGLPTAEKNDEIPFNNSSGDA